MSEQTDNCPTCGAKCKIVGNTTKHYEPIEQTDRDLREFIWERCEMDDKKTYEIMDRILKEFVLRDELLEDEGALTASYMVGFQKGKDVGKKSILQEVRECFFSHNKCPICRGKILCENLLGYNAPTVFTCKSCGFKFDQPTRRLFNKTLDEMEKNLTNLNRKEK